MTKAAFIDETGGAEMFAIREHDLAPPGPGQIQVRNTAISLNFIDVYQRSGLYPVAFPAILGSEGVGVIEALGDGVEGFSVGDRVAYLGSGSYAENTNAAAMMAAKIPDRVSDEAAGAAFLKGLTVQMLLRQVHEIKPEDTILVFAAAGGVGTLLCQWALHIGAKVIAVVGNEDKARIARADGVENVLIRTQTDNLAADVRKMTGGAGVNVVYDSIGAATFETSLNCLAPLGHLVSYGNASGPAPAVTPLELGQRGSLTLTRPILFHYATPVALPAMADALFALMDKNILRPAISERLPLSDVAKAHRLLESGQTIGAIILTP